MRPREIKPLPWTEVVGTIDRIEGEFITLRVGYKIRLNANDLTKWSDKLHKGSKIGIIFTDGGVRIRILDEEER